MATKTFKIGLSNADKAAMAQDIYERLIGMSFDEYDSAKTYNTGDFVVYESPADTFKLYECNSDNVTGAWDSSKWDLATFQTLIDNIEDAVAFVNDKANVDGNYPTMTVGAADNLTPYDAESGTLQQQPFLFQGTGCGNGEQQVDTGALALLKEKQGHSVVVNNHLQEGNFPSLNSWAANGLTATFTDNVATLVSSADNQSLYHSSSLVAGHRYLFIITAKNVSNVSYFTIGWHTSFAADQELTNDWKTYFVLTPAVADDSIYTYIYLRQTGTAQFKNFCAIDLTQMFGSDDAIPAHLLSHPEDFFRYYQGSLAYNEGTLVNSNGRYLKTIGRQQWDEEWEVGGIEPDGSLYPDQDRIRSKNYIRVIPNTTYYSKTSRTTRIVFYDKDKNFISYTAGTNETFETPSNCLYAKFVVYNDTTYNHDITISIYYEDESGYDQYYPYEELANIDTGTETLRSAGSVKDSKAPDGTITRRVASYTFTGSESWSSRGSDTNVDYYVSTNLLSVDGKTDLLGNILCSNGYCGGNAYSGNELYLIGTDGKTVYIAIPVGADPNTVFANGVVMNYEVLTPTTEQGTPYSENVAIDDFGSMEFAAANGVPTGATLFYAVDYKAFVDSLYNTLDGDATDIVKESALDTKLAALGYVKLTSVTGYDATKTQVLKNVEGTLTWVTEE